MCKSSLQKKYNFGILYERAQNAFIPGREPPVSNPPLMVNFAAPNHHDET
tara:strand:- start:137 stop:286 length:150 start_codon:yes stop_codon:yes gene_type:complete